MAQHVPVLDIFVGYHLVFEKRAMGPAELFNLVAACNQFPAHRQIRIGDIGAVVPQIPVSGRRFSGIVNASKMPARVAE